MQIELLESAEWTTLKLRNKSNYFYPVINLISVSSID